MNHPNDERESPLSPEWLAGYADGELDAAARRAVDAWLQDHPEAAAAMDGQRRLDQVFQENPPAAPTEAAWQAVHRRIESGWQARERKAQGWRLTLGVAAALTAAASLVFVLVRPTDPVTPLPPGSAEVVQVPQGDEEEAEDLFPEPFAVVGSDEVRILSLDPADVGCLVVGERPVAEPIELATVNDVRVKKVEPDEDGMTPQVQGTFWPLVVAPPAPGKEP